ncbi:MAG: hypothetical protein IJU32_02300, partial [Pyramidobacter sp.]|nr:hypothetical protein [Pyramidobacter sp.]
TAVLRSEDGCAPDKLVEIRRRGYAVSYDEMGQGSIGLGTPILDANGVAVGALNLSGPVSRLTDSVVSRGIDSLVDAAKRISEELRAKS